MRRLGCILLIIIGLGLLGAGGNFIYGWRAAGPATEDVNFTVAGGASFKNVAVELKKAGLIRSADAFYARARLFAGSPVVKAGEYMIPKGASNSQIVQILTEGVGVNRFVTVPEGMPSILVYERLMANDQLTGKIDIPAEGSVLPDTYAYDKGESRAAVLARMQAAMTKVLDAAWEKRSPRTIVKSKEEAVTLASIIEKETSIEAERTTVAGVYTNRLRQGMMLQADPTIIYPITKGKPLGRRIRKSEIESVNDYNTYAMTGLPKGPIANPSKSSIEAALNPKDTQALYFVADGKGGHIFANTLAEHNENVRKWFEIRRARGEM
ncbi:MAG: endolytic transglycosylase MltG [Sphingobium sp.]|nr:endolytic transglycosylase MltG [Sphingobium sp.]